VRFAAPPNRGHDDAIVLPALDALLTDRPFHFFVELRPIRHAGSLFGIQRDSPLLKLNRRNPTGSALNVTTISRSPTPSGRPPIRKRFDVNVFAM
jgi:hypothetical protein